MVLLYTVLILLNCCSILLYLYCCTVAVLLYLWVLSVLLSCRQMLAGQRGDCYCCLVESSGWASIRVLVDQGMTKENVTKL